MTIKTMLKKCVNCGKEYSINPSVSDPGIMCPYCKKPANVKFKGKRIDAEDKAMIKEMLDDYKKNGQ